MKDLSNENIVHVNKNGVQYLQFRKLLEYSNVITHAYLEQQEQTSNNYQNKNLKKQCKIIKNCVMQ